MVREYRSFLGEVACTTTKCYTGNKLNLRMMMPAQGDFAGSMEAKQFLVSRIAEEARRQNEPLPDLEEKMLYFSETFPTLPHSGNLWH